MRASAGDEGGANSKKVRACAGRRIALTPKAVKMVAKAWAASRTEEDCESAMPGSGCKRRGVVAVVVWILILRMGCNLVLVLIACESSTPKNEKLAALVREMRRRN